MSIENAVRRQVRNAVREPLREVEDKLRQLTARANPADDEDDDLDDDEDGDDDEGGGGDEGEYYSFEFNDEDARENDYKDAAAFNLACACGAWRTLDHEDDPLVVASQKPTGRAFCGSEADLDDYAAENDLQDGWEVFDDPADILAMPFDKQQIREMMAEETSVEWKDAQDFNQKFHWGDRAAGVTAKVVPNVQGPLTFLGVARRTDYFAMKDGEPAEYFHHHGEESGEFPSLYTDVTKTVLIIHGGKMTVTPDGVKD